MCINCALEATVDFEPNPNPQKDREYPAGWDLAGLASPDPLGAKIGSREDDTLRMVYVDSTLALRHLVMAQSFAGHPMELFSDGRFLCYRPAIVKDGRPQPPAWHVMPEDFGS